jgi:MFS family permease
MRLVLAHVMRGLGMSEAMLQSSWAMGFALAALVSGIVLRSANWRAVFFVGILPALVTLWIRNRVPESEMWQEIGGLHGLKRVKGFNHRDHRGVNLSSPSSGRPISRARSRCCS